MCPCARAPVCLAPRARAPAAWAWSWRRPHDPLHARTPQPLLQRWLPWHRLPRTTAVPADACVACHHRRGRGPPQPPRRRPRHQPCAARFARGASASASARTRAGTAPRRAPQGRGALSTHKGVERRALARVGEHGGGHDVLRRKEVADKRQLEGRVLQDALAEERADLAKGERQDAQAKGKRRRRKVPPVRARRHTAGKDERERVYARCGRVIV